MAHSGQLTAAAPKRRGRAELHVRRAADLQPLLALRPRVGTLFVEAPALAEGERRDWQARLRHDLSQCGCHSGRALGVVGGVAAVAYLAWAPVAQAPWLHGAVAAGLVLAGLACGLGLGLLRARLQLRRHVRRLQRRLAADPARAA